MRIRSGIQTANGEDAIKNENHRSQKRAGGGGGGGGEELKRNGLPANADEQQAEGDPKTLEEALERANRWVEAEYNDPEMSSLLHEAHVAGRIDRAKSIQLMFDPTGNMSEEHQAGLFYTEAFNANYFDALKTGRPSTQSATMSNKANAIGAMAAKDFQVAAIMGFTAKYSKASSGFKDAVARDFVDGTALPKLKSKNPKVRAMHKDLSKRIARIEEVGEVWN